MWGLGRRPTKCLKVGAQAIVWGESSRTWRGRHRYRCVLSPTPAGVVKLSSIDGNVIDRPAFEERLRSLVGPAKRWSMFGRTLLSDIPRPITLVLPDLAVRATVIQLAQVPARREEQKNVLCERYQIQHVRAHLSARPIGVMLVVLQHFRAHYRLETAQIDW